MFVVRCRVRESRESSKVRFPPMWFSAEASQNVTRVQVVGGTSIGASSGRHLWSFLQQ